MRSQAIHEQRRAALIEGAVRAVAERGLENTSTNLISRISGLNEAYIYRYFENKEDLLAKAFAESDDRFLSVILDSFPAHPRHMTCRQRFERLFRRCWDYIMEREEQVLFYVRYYYSQSFQMYACREHMKRFRPLAERMKEVFSEDADVWALLHQMFDTLLFYAMRVFGGELQDSRAETDRIFERLFRMVVPNFREADAAEEKPVPNTV